MTAQTSVSIFYADGGSKENVYASAVAEKVAESARNRPDVVRVITAGVSSPATVGGVS